jgi:hypothetical protein
VWILVIHYAFSDDELLKRSGNARDLELLYSLFGEYQDCIYREIASPRTNEIAQILSKDGIVSRFEEGQTSICVHKFKNKCYLEKYFPDPSPPTVFMLFVLSHGGADGAIYTEQGDSFTIYDVWDALSGNQLLQNCLKINVFGVRGMI